MTEKRKPPEGAEPADDIPEDIFGVLPGLSDLFLSDDDDDDDDEGGDPPRGENDPDLEAHMAGYTITLQSPNGLALLRFTFLGDGRLRAAALGTDNQVDALVTQHVGAILHDGLVRGDDDGA